MLPKSFTFLKSWAVKAIKIIVTDVPTMLAPTEQSAVHNLDQTRLSFKTSYRTYGFSRVASILRAFLLQCGVKRVKAVKQGFPDVALSCVVCGRTIRTILTRNNRTVPSVFRLT